MIEYLIISLPVLTGIIMILCGLIIRNRPRGRVKNGVPAEALIIDFAVRTAYMKKIPYKAVSPVVEFQTPDGKKVNAVYPFFINEDYVRFKRGDIIKICYDRNNINRFHIENDGSKSNLSFILLFSGLFMVVADVIMFLKY